MIVRPLMQKTVGELEAMFSTAPTDSNLLAQLSNELKHRNVPRALALYQKVQKALDTARGPDAKTLPLPSRGANESDVNWLQGVLEKARSERQSRQPELWSETPSVPESVSVVSTPQEPPAKPSPAQPISPLPSMAQRSIPSMSADEAYRLLKATPSTPWETIEITRRTIVQLSSPANLQRLEGHKRTERLADARRANQAYAVVCDARNSR
jgi:hypothetical protein